MSSASDRLTVDGYAGDRNRGFISWPASRSVAKSVPFATASAM